MLKVFEISRMTNHNGPGIRTLIHFKGCPLRCIWCSTPESQLRADELQLKAMKCIGDGACMEACPEDAISFEAGRQGPIIDRDKCVRCFACSDECYAGALNRVGKIWDVDALVKEALKDEIFFKSSGGGVTLSGGEPLMYVDDEMVEFYRKLYEKGTSIGVDTTGYVPWENIEKVLPYVDFFLWDLKIMDSKRHKELTGVENERILENLKKVEALAKDYGTDVYIRCVQIPGMTDTDENLIETCEFLKGMTCIKRLDLVNFHHLGKKRYEAIDRPYAMGDAEPLDGDVLLEKLALVEEWGIPCRISM